jgi:predicted ATP-grasp superfamily ATP-dependent carboligase
MKKVLLLGNVGTRGQTLAVLRSLGRGGVSVHLAWHNPACVTLRSRYSSGTHWLPPYDGAEGSWKAALCALMERERFDLVIPLSDVETLACHLHREELTKYGRVYAPNPDACDVLFDKLKTNELARRLGVRLPREIVVSDAGASRSSLLEFGFPLVLKPRRTFGPSPSGSPPRVRKAYSADELNRLLDEMLAAGPVAVQENFIGRGVGIELLLNAGEPLLAFQHMRVHEPLHGGESSYRESATPTPELLDASLRLLGALKYHGVAMVEFKQNPATGAWVFIEVNARFWGSLPVAVAAGADFPLALYQFVVEGRTAFAQAFRRGIRSRNLSLNLEWQRANLRADHADPTLSTQPLSRVVLETLSSVLTGRERIDTFASDDPAPFFAECGRLVRQLAGRVAKGFHAKPKSIPVPEPVAARRASAEPGSKRVPSR